MRSNSDHKSVPAIKVRKTFDLLDEGEGVLCEQYNVSFYERDIMFAKNLFPLYCRFGPQISVEINDLFQPTYFKILVMMDNVIGRIATINNDWYTNKHSISPLIIADSVSQKIDAEFPRFVSKK